MKVVRSSTSYYRCRRRRMVRRTVLIVGCAVVVVVAVVAVILLNRPLSDIPVSPESSESSLTSMLEPMPSSTTGSGTPSEGTASSDSPVTSEPSSTASEETPSSETSSQLSSSEWTPPTPPADGPAYTKLYPDMYAQPASTPNEETGIMFLTFDDGPSVNTERILDILKEKGIKATFFVTGQNTSDENMNRMKRIIDEGHSIGIHSYTHKLQEVYTSVEAYLDDFHKMYEKIVEYTGVKPTIFRFPGGSNTGYNEKIRTELVAEMTRRGFTFFDWNIDSGDANGNNIPAAKLVSDTLSQGSNGYRRGIVLMHDLGTKATTVDALPEIIDGLKKQGYGFDRLTNAVPSAPFSFVPLP